ncbi:MAG: DMT family transporter [Clostridium sp.]|nr:DMT family transporter [Clostridium sp.]
MTDKSIYKDERFIAIIAALCCFLWGSAYPAIKNGYILFKIHTGDVQAELVFAGYRFIIAGIMVLVIAKILGRKLLDISRKDAANLFALGIVETAVQYYFFYVGVSNTTGVKGSIVNALGTFFSVILAHFIYTNDKITGRKALGCIIGFIGVMIVNFSSDLLQFSFKFKGEGFVAIAALFFSIGSIYGKELSNKMDVTIVTGYNLLIGGIILAILGFIKGGTVTNFNVESTSLLVYLGFLSAVAFSLWALLLKHNKVGKVTIYNFLIPVFGVLLSSIFLGENILELKNLFALVFVCIGIWFVNTEKNTLKSNINMIH